MPYHMIAAAAFICLTFCFTFLARLACLLFHGLAVQAYDRLFDELDVFWCK